MAVFHHFQCVAFEVDLPVKVHFVERLHRDLLLAIVPRSVLLGVELEIMLDWATWITRFLVFARRYSRCDRPEGDEDREEGKERDEDVGDQSAGDLARYVERDQSGEGDEEGVGEGVAAGGVGRQGGILDGRILHIVSSDQIWTRSSFWTGSMAPENLFTYGCGTDSIVLFRRDWSWSGWGVNILKVVRRVRH